MKNRNTNVIVGVIIVVLAVCVCAAIGATASIIIAGNSLVSIPTSLPAVDIASTALAETAAVAQIIVPGSLTSPAPTSPPEPTFTPQPTYTFLPTYTFPPIDTPRAAAITLPPPALPTTAFQTIALPDCIPPQTPQVGQVTEIVDGDTIHVLIDGRDFSVRYIGMDTPENTTEHEVLGPEASDFNRALVANQTVVLYRDQSETDRYDRLLRYVFVGDKFVNAELVRAGFAEAKEYPPDTACAALLYQAMLGAQQAGIGLWGIVAAVPSLTPIPAQPTLSSSSGCLIKGNINSEGEKIYHMPGMRDYNRTIIDESKGERWFCTEQEAIAAGWRRAMQ